MSANVAPKHMVILIAIHLRRPWLTLNGRVTGVLIHAEILGSLKTSPISDKLKLTKFDDPSILDHISSFA